MPSQVFTNPLAAFRDVDWRRGRYNDTPQDFFAGNWWRSQLPVDMLNDVCWDFVVAAGAGGAVSEGTIMVLVLPPNASTPPKLKSFAVGDSDYLIFGVAIASALVGQKVGVVTRGFCHPTYETSSGGAGNLMIAATSNPGVARPLAPGSVTAATVQGTLHGVTVTATDETAVAGPNTWTFLYGNPV